VEEKEKKLSLAFEFYGVELLLIVSNSILEGLKKLCIETWVEELFNLIQLFGFGVRMRTSWVAKFNHLENNEN